MCRLFHLGDFHHVPRPLYLQRIHGANTQCDPQINAHIQSETVALYDKYIEAFWYYTDDQYRAFVPEIEARFQSSRLVTYFPTEWHARNDISYVAANLIAMKDGAERCGGLLVV
ncbi:hypothetical protein [Streptomyces laurentii]|uniref:hypothetical protein n=1 Tax=Streptomyces laurentii TaxID=39478 RepID=UPI0033D49F56